MPINDGSNYFTGGYMRHSASMSWTGHKWQYMQLVFKLNAVGQNLKYPPTYAFSVAESVPICHLINWYYPGQTTYRLISWLFWCGLLRCQLVDQQRDIDYVRKKSEKGPSFNGRLTACPKPWVVQTMLVMHYQLASIDVLEILIKLGQTSWVIFIYYRINIQVCVVLLD